MKISYANHFLIAYPTLLDPNFAQAVVYLYEHNEEGAMGLVINKPLKMQLHEVFEHLDIEINNKEIAERSVMMGGPLGQEHGFVLYRDHEEKKVRSKKRRLAIQNQEGVGLSSSKETLMMIANDQGPHDFVVTLGYAGWESGQLEEEFQQNDWLIAPVDLDIIFNTPVEKRWHRAAALIGVDINHLSGHTGHA